MFSPAPKTKLAQRTLGALRVARSFLMLEDDYDVDWEVDQDERTRVPHPHRAALRGGYAQRRVGQVPARPQACLCPMSRGDLRHQRVCLRRSEWPASAPCADGSESGSSGLTHEHRLPRSATSSE
ncbi:MAG TPA: hypothetical protein VIH71_13575 [Solirubrobacteraceae bacterium]